MKNQALHRRPGREVRTDRKWQGGGGRLPRASIQSAANGSARSGERRSGLSPSLPSFASAPDRLPKGNGEPSPDKGQDPDHRNPGRSSHVVTSRSARHPHSGIVPDRTVSLRPYCRLAVIRTR